MEDLTKKYPGIPDSKIKVMERCVEHVMSQGHDKSSAIAICHTSIMGSKKADMPKQIVVNINLADYEKNYLSDEIVDSVEDSNILVESETEGGEKNMTDIEKQQMAGMDSKMKACVMGQMKSGMSMKDAMAACEKQMKSSNSSKVDSVSEGGEKNMSDIKKEDVVVDDTKSEDKAPVEGETTPVEGETPVEGDKPEGEGEKAVVDETPVEDKHTPAEEGDVKIDKSAKEAPAKDDIDKSDKVFAEINNSLKKLNDLLAEKDEDKQEKKVEKSAPVRDEETISALEKVSSSMAKVAEEMKNDIGELKERIVKLEEQPVPSKVVSSQVVSKGGSEKTPDQARVDEINSELTKLEDMKKYDTDTYQKQRKWEDAFKLIAERDRLSQG